MSVESVEALILSCGFSQALTLVVAIDACGFEEHL